MAALTDFAENRLTDWFFRGQALGITGASAGAGSGPTALFIGLFTATPGEATAGTEVSGNGYARVSVASNLTNWAGTQGAGTTVASSGSSGTTSNNSAITFPTPTPSGWGTVVAVGIFDASTGGNLIAYGALTVSKTVNSGDTVSFPAGSLQFQWDN